MISLAGVTVALAQAVLAHAPLDVPHVQDWPHADTCDALRPLAEHPSYTGAGTFLVLRDDLVVGDCGWFGPPDKTGEVEIGYGVAPSVRRQGVASAAVALLLDWVTVHGARTVRAEVLPGNEPSLRLLARLGFTDVGEHAGHRVLTRSVSP